MASAGELDACVKRARAAHPTVDVPVAEFTALLAERAAGPPPCSVGDLRIEDLWLALGCARGDVAALRELEAAMATARVALARMHMRGDAADEVLQIVRERMLVAEPGETPRILAAAGHGELRGLLRVAAVRTALNLRRRDHRIEHADEPLFAALAAQEDSPEAAALKHEHRAAFKVAVEDVLRSLEPRERNVLRMHLVHQLSIDEIGRTYDVHRATAARWLTSIRDRLQEETRRLLRERLELGDRDLDSLFRVVESQLAVSFRRVLATVPASDKRK
ncbi:MAG TPA: sigma-70 family RNA polymerase sigma factor [Kofleriaceae bacterium]